MPLVSPLYKIRCPYCRLEYHPSDMAIVSLPNPGNELYTPPQQGSISYYSSRFWAQELNGAKYTSELAHRVCPNCRRMLPERDMEESLNIAVVGDTSSGKTHYIAVLIDQLQRGLLVQGGSGSTRLVPLNPETSRTYKDTYYIPIFEERDARPPGTRPGRFDEQGQPIKSDPLVYQLAISKDQASPAKTINLLFYDISGEEIADPSLIVQFGEHILRADAIIYLADPLTMAQVRRHLPSHLQPDPATISGRTAHEVLANITYRYEQYQRIKQGENIAIPTAITLSKSDLLKFTMAVSDQRNFLIFQKKIYDGRVNIQEFAYINQQIKAFLLANNEQAIFQASGRFSNVSFFGVSATGGSAATNGKYVRIDPLRCLDPFVWILWKLGCIESA